MRWHDYPDGDALAAELASRLADAIRTTLDSDDKAWLVLAGGSTPLPAYRALAALTLPWSKVTVIASDERWVPADHPKRNEAALRQIFGRCAGLRVAPLLPESAGGPASADTANALLADAPNRFAAVVLGMGADAHIASLFPRVTPAAALAATGGADAVVMTPDPLPPEAPFARVSLGLPRLLRSAQVHLAISGAKKRGVLEQAVSHYDPVRWPVSALLRAAPQLDVHWSH